MTPTKADAVLRSPGSPASPAPRSKRKEGKENLLGLSPVEIELIK